MDARPTKKQCVERPQSTPVDDTVNTGQTSNSHLHRTYAVAKLFRVQLLQGAVDEGNVCHTIFPPGPNQPCNHEIRVDWNKNTEASQINNLEIAVAPDNATEPVIRIVIPYELMTFSVTMFQFQYRIEVIQTKFNKGYQCALNGPMEIYTWQFYLDFSTAENLHNSGVVWSLLEMSLTELRRMGQLLYTNCADGLNAGQKVDKDSPHFHINNSVQIVNAYDIENAYLRFADPEPEEGAPRGGAMEFKGYLKNPALLQLLMARSGDSEHIDREKDDSEMPEVTDDLSATRHDSECGEAIDDM